MCFIGFPGKIKVLGETFLWNSQLKGLTQIFRTSENLRNVSVYIARLWKRVIRCSISVMCLPNSLPWGECLRSAVLFRRPHCHHPTGFLWARQGDRYSFFLCLNSKLYPFLKILILNWHLFIVLAGLPIRNYALRREWSGWGLFRRYRDQGGNGRWGCDFEKHR